MYKRQVVIRCLSLPKEQPSLSNYEFEGMYKNSNDILGETVTTDIDVYFGTHRVTSYNTGGNMTVSYTHLDVYKRQEPASRRTILIQICGQGRKDKVCLFMETCTDRPRT